MIVLRNIKFNWHFTLHCLKLFWLFVVYLLINWNWFINLLKSYIYLEIYWKNFDLNCPIVYMCVLFLKVNSHFKIYTIKKTLCIVDLIFQTYNKMLRSEPSCCWASTKTIGLVIGFSRIILLSNMIAFRTISLPFDIFIQEAMVPRE